MSIRSIRNILSVLVLGFFILACSLIPGRNSNNSNPNATATQSTKTVETSQPQGTPTVSNASNFLAPPDTKTISNQSEMLTGQVKMSVDEIVAFYRKELAAKGLTEDKTLTSITKTTFSLVFTGSSNGKNMVVQGTDLGDGSVAFSVRYE